MRNSIGVLSTFILLATFVGCGALQPEKKLISMKPNIDVVADGISVLIVEVTPSQGELGEHLAQFGESLEDKPLISNLEQEGMHVRLIAASDITGLVSSIGEVINNEIVWHGQMVDWRDIHQRKVLQQGMLISRKKVPYFIRRGYLSLLARSWLIGREDGLFMYLQTMPTWHIPRSVTLSVDQAKTPLQSSVFQDISVEVLLQDGEALVFAVELPREESPEEQHDAEPTAVRFGEALMGAPVTQDVVSLLVIEANILPRQ